MSATRYLNELETERLEIEQVDYDKLSKTEKSAWWERLGDWWRKRDLGFGDGSGMASHCFAMARKHAIPSPIECEFCGDKATKVETFDRDVPVCDSCSADTTH